MTPRERILATLDRKPVDRRPVDLWHTPEIGAQLRAHFGVSDDLALYRAMDLDKIVWVFPDAPPSNETDGVPRNAWGVPLVSISGGGATYAEVAEAPLGNITEVRELEDYPHWPDPAQFDYAGVAARAAEATAAGFATIGPWVSLFEIYCQLRGLEQSLMDLLTEPELTEAILGRVMDIQTAMMDRMFTTCGSNLDMVFISDDMGSQHGPLISMDLWLRFFEAPMRKWCRFVHDRGLRVFYHSDGSIAPLVGPLIDCGIDVLNPIQHLCPGMDRGELKRLHGDGVIFHGGVDNQRALPFGTVEEVRAETRACLSTLGAGGRGYIPASCHNVQPGTPTDNILAMIETAREG